MSSYIHNRMVFRPDRIDSPMWKEVGYKPTQIYDRYI